MVTNDLAESSFSAVTTQVQNFSRIGLASAAAVSDIKRNRFLAWDGGKKFFHGFPEDIKTSLVVMAMEDAPKARTDNVELVNRQHEARRHIF